MLTYVVAVSVRRCCRAMISDVLRACNVYICVAKSTVIPMVWRACVSRTSVSVAFGARLRRATCERLFGLLEPSRTCRNVCGAMSMDCPWSARPRFSNEFWLCGRSPSVCRFTFFKWILTDFPRVSAKPMDVYNFSCTLMHCFEKSC